MLVRLYPAFHAGLSVLTVTSLGAAWAFGQPAFRSPRALWLASGVLGGALCLGVGLAPAGVRSLARFDNFRWVLIETSPSLGVAVHLGAYLVPERTSDEELSHELGISIVFVTHQLELVRRLASAVAVLDAGQLCELTPAAEFFAQPRSDAGRRLSAAETRGHVDARSFNEEVDDVRSAAGSAR